MLELIFSSYCFISLIAKKSKREISRVFSAFPRFYQNRKMSTFSRFLCSAFLIYSCQKMAQNPDQNRLIQPFLSPVAMKLCSYVRLLKMNEKLMRLRSSHPRRFGVTLKVTPNLRGCLPEKKFVRALFFRKPPQTIYQ